VQPTVDTQDESSMCSEDMLYMPRGTRYKRRLHVW
jgi:hypothetical protein